MPFSARIRIFFIEWFRPLTYPRFSQVRKIVLQEITDPVQGKLNLFTNQYKHYSKKIAQMRAENRPHYEIDLEISFMGYVNMKIEQICKENGAYEVLINKNALTTEEYESISIPVGKTNEEIETALIKEHATKVKISNFSSLTIEDKIHQLLNTLGEERQIGTKVLTYNKDLEQTIRNIFEIPKSKEQKQ